MQQVRRARLQAVILEELSLAVRDLKDPRVPSVTFTRAEVTPDGSEATTYVMIFGGAITGKDAPSEKEKAQKMKECLAGLSSSAGFLRRHLSKVLTVRHVPVLHFREDKGLENTLRVHELLKKIDHESPVKSEEEE